MNAAEGIILKIQDFRERDERIVLYTKNLGKISVVAKGAKKIEAKLRGGLDIFNFVGIIFVEGDRFNILTNVEVLNTHPFLIRDRYVYKAAYSAVKMLDYIFEENLYDPDFFTVFRHTIEKLNAIGRLKGDISSGLYSWVLLKKFQMKILDSQGYEEGLNKVGLPSAVNTPAHGSVSLTANSLSFLKMISGHDITSVRLSRDDLINVENMLMQRFANIFSYKINSWIPTTS